MVRSARARVSCLSSSDLIVTQAHVYGRSNFKWDIREVTAYLLKETVKSAEMWFEIREGMAGAPA
jgi:hypothetical protein